MLRSCLLSAAVSVLFAASAQAAPPTLQVRSGPALIEVDALADDMVRVRLAPSGTLAEDASWAALPEVRAGRAATQDASDARSAGFRTGRLQVKVDRRTLAVTVSDLEGHVLSADLPERPWASQGAGFTLRKALPADEHVVGFGDKTGPLDRRGMSFTNWNTDRAVELWADPLYKTIPFFIGVKERGPAYGLFLDDTWRSRFDFAHGEPGVLQIGADGGPIDYYVILGPTVKQVALRYADLTGKPPMPPKWAFGYQQSRYSYMSADEVKGIVARARADRFPLDVVWMDIDYQDRNRPFTTNPKTFPDLAGLAKEVGAQGVKLVTITDLHVAKAPGQGYAPYDTGAAADAFVHAADGSVFSGEVWPGPSVFPDFTYPPARAWWGGQYRDFVRDGIAGFWNDMDEPSVFDGPGKTMPLDNRHRIAGDGFSPRVATHAEVHNVVGMQNSRATYEGVLKLDPDSRPFVMTRATYAGGQRWSTTWTGDNASSFEQLKLGVAQTLNMGLSGFGYTAVDVGGFTGGPSAELLTRWFEVAAFTPLFRDHSAKGTPRAEPWVDGPEAEALRRRYVEARYRLAPYLYALADEAHRTGAPLMRPVFYDYPQGFGRCDTAMSWTLGSRLLVAGPPQPESPQAYDICLPSAGGWYDYWSGRRVKGVAYDGGEVLRETPRLDRLPVFVRAGSIIPQQPLVQSLSQTPDGPLELHVWPGPDCSGVIYEDDGVSRGFERGVFLRQAVSCTASPGGVEVAFGPREGSFRPWWRSLRLVVHDVDGAARVAGGEGARYDAQARTFQVDVPDAPRAGAVSLAFGG